MAIITISRASYSRGKAVAEKVAEKLGYECISREIIAQASEKFNIPELKLSSALHDSPSILERFTYSKETYIAYIRWAFLERVRRDNVVYHGLAGHFFLKNAPNVLKVRILANTDDRIREEMKRENISKAEATRLLRKDDTERQRWSQQLYGINTNDAGLYDLVINIDKLEVDHAVDIITSVVDLPCYQSDQRSMTIINDLYTAAKVQALLVKQFPTANVVYHEGVVRICCFGPQQSEQSDKVKVEKLIQDVEGVERIKFVREPAMVSY